MADKLEAIRTSVTEFQRNLIDEAWNRYIRSNGTQWPLMREILIPRDPAEVSAAIASLEPGTVFVEQDRLQITSLGVLLSSNAATVEANVVKFLEWLRQCARANPAISHIKSDDMPGIAALTEEEYRELGWAVRLLEIHEGSEGPGGGRWHLRVSGEIARIAHARDLREYVQDRALEIARRIAEARRAFEPSPATVVAKTPKGVAPAQSPRIRAGLIVSTGLERYKLGGQLGQGGTSAVWSANNESGERVAIKFLDPDILRSVTRRRFRNEMRFCEVTQHPNIVRSLDRGLLTLEGKEYVFYVMPYYPETLREVLTSDAPISRRLALFGEALAGLEYAHMQGIVHRDLKPENILVDRDRAVLADFGIAKLGEEALATTVITGTGERLANFVYAAPEQRTMVGHVTQASDVYAMGLILNELFTGHVLQGAGYALISDIAPEFAYFDSVVESMIQHRADRRLRTAAEIRARIQQAETEASGLERIGVLQRQAEKARTRPVESGVAPLRIVRQDYVDGTLVFWFDRMPDSAWRHALSNLYVMANVRGYGPNDWRVSGDQATLAIDHAIAGEVGRAFRDWLPSVEAEAKARREQEIQEQNARAEAAAREEAEREQQRLEVLRQLEPGEMRSRP